MIPSSVTLANFVTFLRAALVPVIGYFVYLAQSHHNDTWDWAACLLFVFAASTDFVDGWLARKMNTITEWGALWDPIADKMLVIGVLAILAYFNSLWWWVVILITVREVGMTLWRMMIINQGGGVVAARNLGKYKTTTQLVGIVMILAPIVPTWWGQIVILISVVLTVVSALDLLWMHYKPAATSTV